MKPLIAAVVAITISGCSSISTETDYNTEVDFSRYQTWDWVQTDKKEEKPSLHHNGLVDQRIRNAVGDQLSVKGLAQTDQEQADLLVNYFTTFEKKVDVDTFYSSFGYYPYRWGYHHSRHSAFGTETRVREYNEGTLVVDLIDAENKQLVWRGSASDTVRKNLTPDERKQKIDETVMAILAQYPYPKDD